MKSLSIFLLSVSLLSACHRNEPDSPTPVAPEPPLTEATKTNSSISAERMYLTFRNSNLNAFVFSSFSSSTVSFKEVGFCLSDSDSLLSILNPNQQRIKAPSGYTADFFRAELPGLQAGKRYYIDSYAITTTGEIYYGRNNAGIFTTTNKQSQIKTSSFVLPTATTAANPSALVVDKANLPIANASQGFTSFFTANNTLYTLSGLGELFAYQADMNQWVAKQRLKTRVNNTDTEAHFNGVSPVVFTVNNIAYVYFTDFGNAGQVYNLWSYDPVNDKWSFLTNRNYAGLFSTTPAYVSGQQAYFYNPNSNLIWAFNSRDTTFTTMNQAGKSWLYFIPGATQPIAYYLSSSGSLIGRYDPVQGVIDAKPLLAEQNNGAIPQHVVTSQGDDVLLGSGVNTISPDETTALRVSVLNDELIRYSTTKNGITARYNIDKLNDAYWNRQVHPTDLTDRNYGFYFTTLTVGDHVYVIDSFAGSLKELIFK